MTHSFSGRHVLAALFALSTFTSALIAHGGQYRGGQYRGPGDTTPSGPGGGRGTGGPAGPTTGGPAAPSTPGPAAPSTGPAGPSSPGPSGPATGGPIAPGGARGPTTGGRGVQLEDDPSRWELWWEFNKDPFLRLKQAIHRGGIQTGSDEFYLGATKAVAAYDSLKPTESQILTSILPALKKALDSTEQRDIVSSCMVAMAKVGKDHPDFTLGSVYAPRLRSRDLETQETAALAFGIAALPDADSIELLTALAQDAAAGRTACDSREVHDRTRVFATYALGLLAHRNRDAGLERRIFAVLRGLLDDDKASSRNLKVAAVNAIGLLNPGGSDGDPEPRLKEAVETLTAYYVADLGVGEQLMQSHCPTAIAKLLGRSTSSTAVAAKKMFLLDLVGKGRLKRSSDDIARSCALALGLMCQPYEDAKDPGADADCSRQLLEQYRNHKDSQTRYFSLLALGQIGGRQNHDALIREFDRAKNLEKPWCALAMGVYAFQKYAAAELAGVAPESERALGETLRAALDQARSPNVLAGVAIGLGLCRCREAADDLRALLTRTREEQLAGYVCIGLALMDDKRAVEDIRTVVNRSLRKPALLQQAAIALGKLGDKEVAEALQDLLGDDDRNLAKLSAIASALGLIGDARTIEPLKQMLFDERLTALSRAFAAVALGGVGDKEDLPWNSKIGANLNYRAKVETLTGSGAGILDIL